MKNMQSVLLVSTYNSTFINPLQNAFKKLGFKSTTIDYRSIIGNLLLHPLRMIYLTVLATLSTFFTLRRSTSWRILFLNKLLILYARIYKPNYLFVVKGETITGETISSIKTLGVTTMIWQVDPVFDAFIQQSIKDTGCLYDIYVTCEPGKEITHLRKRGFKHVLYMLGAADGQNIEQCTNYPKKYDISLVGTYHSRRVTFMNALKGLDAHIWGWGKWKDSSVREMFEGSAIPQSEMLDVYKKTKVVINVNQSIGSIPTNLRPFEAGQVGAFILVDYKKGLEKIFKIGEEIDCFRTPSELRKKAELYLKFTHKREKIAKALQNRIKKDHTYETRLKKLFYQINKLGY